MRFDCESAREHIDAWALGALDSDEKRALEAHLTSCDACSKIADGARETASSVALAVPLHGSSAALKARVVGAGAVLTDIGRRQTPRWWRTAAAAMFVVTLGAAGWAVYAQTRMNDLENENARISEDATAVSDNLAAARVELVDVASRSQSQASTIDTQNRVLNIAFQPDVVWTTLDATEDAPGATGRCVWSRTQELGAFLADNLPPAPYGQAYRMWVVYERKWVGGGTVEVDDQGRGQLIIKRVWPKEDYGAFEGYAVTLEPIEGSAMRQGEVMLASYRP